MNAFAYLVSNAASVLVGALQLFMFIRAILSWLPMMEDSAFTEFIFQVTEVVVYPVRCLMERSEWVMSMPIDLSFFITFILLSVVQTLLL